MQKSKNKKKYFQEINLFCLFLLFLFFPRVSFAGSNDYQRCEPGENCILGEYVFGDDGQPIDEQACVIHIKNPSGSTVADGVSMDFASDGWHSYIFSANSPEGLYRSLVCCEIGSESACLDKSFILGTSFESIDDVKSDTQLIRNSTFDFSGFADASSTNSTLVDSELTGADDYWNNYVLEMITGDNAGEERVVTDFNSTSHTLSFSAFSSAIATSDQYALRHESQLISGIWNYANRTLTSASNIAGDIWGYSSRTLSSFGVLAADIWNNTFAPTRILTSEDLSNGEELSTVSSVESNTENLKDELMVELGDLEVDILATDSKIDTVITNTTNIEARLNVLDNINSNVTTIAAGWSGYDTSELSSKLDDVYDQVKEISTEELDDDLASLEDAVNDDLHENKSLQNKLIEIKATIDLNQSIIKNEPAVKVFYEWGSVVLKVVVANPSTTKQIINFRSALPKEIRPENVIKKSDDLKLEFDTESNRWFVSGSVELAGKKSETKFIEVIDIWKISNEEMDSLRSESENLFESLKDTGFSAQGATIKNDIDLRLENIKLVQNQEEITPEEHFLNYRKNKLEIETIQKNIEILKKIVNDVNGGNNFKKSFLGVSTTMTWKIISVVIVGAGILLIFLIVAFIKGRNFKK